ncbi:MAG: glycosyltransferase family 39 protein [Planctomycetes bacterium]|nr:glycosyltransferase family 39 protein [Planctomycetota bacterium]
MGSPPKSLDRDRASLPARAAAFLILPAVLVTATVWNQSLVHWRENVLDSYLFGYYGWCVAGGARPYLDVWDNKPPGIWWANALAFRLLGDGPGADWLVGSGALLVSLAAFVQTARSVWHPSLAWPAAGVAALLLTHLSYECGANRTETLVAACELLGVCLYSQAVRTRRDLWLLAAGIVLGAAPWCKQSGIAAAAAVGLHLMLSRRRRKRPTVAPFALLLAGYAMTTLAGIGLLAADGALAAAYEAVISFNRFYFEIGDATWWRLIGPLKTYAPAVPPVMPVALVAAPGAGLALINFVRRRRREAGSTEPVPMGFSLVWWVWLLVGGYLVCVGVGRLPYHLAPLLPPLGLLALDGLGAVVGAEGLASGAIRRPSVAAYLVLLLAACVQTAGASFAEARQCASRRPEGVRLGPAPPPQYVHQAALIASCGEPADRMYVWGWSPGTYRFAYRRCPSRFGTFEKLGQLGERVAFIRDEAKQALQQNPPAILAISPRDWHGMHADASDHFGTWLRDAYDDRGEVEGMHIFARRTAAKDLR